MENTQLLLLPKPRRVQLHDGHIQLSSKPLSIKGINADLISVLNACCVNLPSINCPNREQLFTAYSSVSTENLEDPPIPDVLIRARQDLTPHLPTLSVKQYNFTAKEARTEAYRLIIQEPSGEKDSAIIIDAETKSGARHALFTLVQIIGQFGRELPIVTIEDAPAFPVRGVMLDVSRDRVPLQSELLKTIDLLASFKINHLELYTEHTFAYEGHKEVWKNSSPLTPSEIRELDNRCVERGITLAANQNCFGHMHRWLKHDNYKPLAEITGDWSFNGMPRSGPFSLCPIDPGSIRLVEDLLNQLIPCFSSGLVNIGCDETFDVGQGRSKNAIKSKGALNVYWDYVSRVMDIVREHNARPMFWADMWLGSKKKEREKIPKDSTGLAWGYEPDSDFSNWCKALDAEERNVWICPGTSSWRSITGRTNERKANIYRAVSEGLKGGANGALITDWGDLGHRQQWPVALNGLAEAADVFWSGRYNDGCENAISLHAFGDKNLVLSLWLNELGNSDINLREIAGKYVRKTKSRRLMNSSCLFVDLESPLSENPFDKKVADWSTVRNNLSWIASLTPELENQLLTDELKLTVETAKFACERAILRRRRNEMFTKKPAELIQMLRNIIDEHSRLWKMRSRTGGLEDSCQYYDYTLKDLIKNG